jgi:SAM-dependent methyltransferase
MSVQPMQSRTPLPEAELRSLLLEYRKENWEGIQLPDIQRSIVEATLLADSCHPLRVAETYVAITPASRILDLGSGVGSFVVACRERGLKAFGLEPDKIGTGAKITSIEIARRRLCAPVFVNGIGEHLPFPNSYFDVVVMNQVIEHVMDQEQVIQEAARILRPGGVIYIACPNYLRPYEPHYKIRWFPLLPKAIGRAYLRFKGRSPAMLNQITYTTNARLSELLTSLGPDFEFIDIHQQQFLEKRSSGSFAARSTRIITWMTRLPAIGGLLLRIVLKYASLTEGGCEMVVLKRASASIR